MFDKLNRSVSRALAIIAVLFLSACSKSFVVTSEVPRPLIEKMPVTAKLVYPEGFQKFVYVEAGDDRALERVDFGQAQVGLFEQVFGDLLTLVDDSAGEYDFKIEPHILDFQYSVPAETKLNMYEIWLKYRLRITDDQDSEIADWVVKGYGKTPTSMLASQLKAFNTASNVALRDIGAQLALGFPTQPSIEDYLARGKTRPSSEEGDDLEAASLADESAEDSQNVSSNADFAEYEAPEEASKSEEATSASEDDEAGDVEGEAAEQELDTVAAEVEADAAAAVEEEEQE